MSVEVDLSNFTWLSELFERRQNLVADLVSEGRQFTEAYVAAGGRKRDPATRRYHPTSRTRGVVRMRQPTGSQYARGIEVVSYRRFMDWWGNW